MKICFLANPEYCLPSLQALIDAPDMEVVLVVTGPDKIRSRRGQRVAGPVKQMALDHGLEVISPEKLNRSEVIDRIKEAEPDFLVVIAFGQLIGKGLRDLYGDRILNLHGSLLPKYRGAAPIQRALLNGDRATGVTSMIVRKELDKGEMLAKKEVIIEDSDDLASLMDKMAACSADLMLYTLRNYDELLEAKDVQDDSLATYAEKISKEEGHLDFNLTADELVRKVKTFKDWPGAVFKYQGENFKVKDARSINEQGSEGEGRVLPGNIISVSAEGIGIQTAKGIFLIDVIQQAGKKALQVKNFINGKTINVGDLVN